QGMFRNPLVSPDILGVSAGAGLGAVMGIFFGLPLGWVQLLAFLGGLLAVMLVYVLASQVRRHDPVLVLVLAGVALGTLLGAAISLLKVLADPYSQLPSITFWLLGGLNGVSFADLAVAAPFMMLGLLPLWLLRWRVNLLSLSDEEAAALGLNITRTRLVLIAAATLITASAVAITGIIGWIGLVIPHMARLLIGPEFSRLLPASLLLGGSFLLLTDTLARSLASIELPLGVLTALIGAPFFLLLLARGGART
ncbi:MAG: iron ABC transporter permease, partial [Pseudomonas sp.]|nr:iron ABC transporter permease [Pseudomonas sp.]